MAADNAGKSVAFLAVLTLGSSDGVAKRTPETTWRYVVVPIKKELLDQLERGELTIREGLDQPRICLVDVNLEGDVTSVLLTNLSDIPSASLPVPGTMIRRELEPEIATRASASSYRRPKT